MDRVEADQRTSAHRQHVDLVELERVVRLRDDVDADDVEAGSVVAHRRAAGATEEIEQPRSHGFVTAFRKDE
jgi:hypothetical protein